MNGVPVPTLRHYHFNIEEAKQRQGLRGLR
jgi:hypothetical protein